MWEVVAWLWRTALGPHVGGLSAGPGQLPTLHLDNAGPEPWILNTHKFC